MRIDERRDGDVTVLALGGDLDARTLPDACARVDALIEGMRIQLVFNLTGMDVVTSTAVSFLIDAAKRTRKLGGDAVLSNPRRFLRNTLEALKIGDFFRIFPGDDEAVAHFRDRALDDTEVPQPSDPPPGWLERLRRRKGP